MIEWRFILNDVEIEEPRGFSDISFQVGRDPMWHGVFIEASTSSLSFYGDAYEILKTAKELYGVDAVVIFTADQRCEGETEWTQAISGKLNFRSYEESCGELCLIKMNVEQSNCSTIFKNRLDQKVNIDSNVSFNKMTVLEDYPGLDFEMELATQETPISADASVDTEGDGLILPTMGFTSTGEWLYIRPVYKVVRDNSITSGNLDIVSNFYEDPDRQFFLTPQVLMEEQNACIDGPYLYDVRLKGDISYTGTFSTDVEAYVELFVWNGDTNIDRTIIHGFTLSTNMPEGVNYPFDQHWIGSLDLEYGQTLYAAIRIGGELSGPQAGALVVNYMFDPETSFLLSNTKTCPPTNADVYLVNEVLARATEAITDRCITMKSDYYGRIDSKPYSSVVDGCGSLRVLTPGLNIRQAEDKDFFASMKELLEGLRPIDNIGMGMEGDILRIEDVRYFYSGVKIMDINLVPESKSNIVEQLVYSNLRTGYEKWEIKSIKGIDEFNSAKEYRTGVQAVSNSLDIRSKFIASGYVIENLRTQTLVNSGNTDSAYDNDIFIICVERDGYGYHVEQGDITDPANFFSPDTAYNWRIRPIYNLMRWFKSVAQSYTALASSASKLFFTSGTGNYLAEGKIDDLCSLESHVIAENSDLSLGDFKNASDGIPIYKPETISFEYPLSISEYNNIKLNPYGFFNVSCGVDGVPIKCFIKQIDYKPSEGQAAFTLIKAWQ